MAARPPQPGQPAGAEPAYNYRPAGVSQNRLLDALADRSLPPEEQETPPTLHNALIKGVFEFPFYFTSLGCLVGTACGLSFSFLMLVFALDQGGQVGVTALRTLGSSAAMAFILTMGFCVAHCQSIFEETAYGADTVQNWPTFDWKGWVLTFFYVAILFAGAGAAGYLLALPRLFGSPLPAAVLAFLLFPVFLLSAIDNNSPFIPISLPVLKSLKTLWWGWWLFYVLTGLLLVGWLAAVLVMLTLSVNVYFVALITGPYMSAMLMIYARLLGRLTWCASQEESDDDD